MNTAAAWIRRLSGFAALAPEDKQTLQECSAGARACATHDALAKSGDACDRVFVVLDGLACRFKLSPDGRRQILAYLFPGDMCDLRQLLMTEFDHAVCTLVPSEVATLSAITVQRLERHANLSLAVERYSVSQQSIAREWLVNVGHRTAFERLSHLICETYERLDAVGLTQNHSFELPLTQSEIGDTLALSAVHVNRTLMELRRLKLVTFQNRHLVIHDYDALRTAAGFDPAYLHVNGQLAATALRA